MHKDSQHYLLGEVQEEGQIEMILMSRYRPYLLLARISQVKRAILSRKVQ